LIAAMAMSADFLINRAERHITDWRSVLR
jgi:hypothetical protein